MPVLRPVIPDPGMRFQLVHEEDVATAFRAGVVGRGEPGPYNLAGSGTLTLSDVARVLGWYSVPMPSAAVDAAAEVVARLPLAPDEISWIHSLRKEVLMRTARAHKLLGWRPKHSSRDTLKETAEAMRAAARTAGSVGTPWVLDPVAVGGLTLRTGLAAELVDLRPTVVRGNASEVLALAGGLGGKGVDSIDTPEAAAETARALAAKHGCVVAVSGAVDHLTDGERLVRVANGHPLLARVTGVGCSLGALMAAFCAVTQDRLVAATAATAALTVAADAAAAAAPLPGTFAVALLDELSRLTPSSLASAVRLS
jgi:hydroxyethylthiazole kinase